MLREWAQRHALVLRDAVLLLPFADLLPVARQAFAADGGWQPRIETLQTLAASFGPPPTVPAQAPSGDVAVDRLLAGALLATLPGVREWRRRDPAAFEQAIGDVVQAAHVLRRGALSLSADARDAWWADARLAMEGALGAGAGSGGLTAALGRVALEWAALGGPGAIDGLAGFRPAGWVQLVAGGDDGAGDALLSTVAAGVPVLRLLADAPNEQLFQELPAQAPRLWCAADAEEEAMAAATAVVEALQAGHQPVALVAEDRLLVRRIRALLERAGVLIADESGWTLSTTRAAAQLMAVLRAAHPAAEADAWLDGLKAEHGGTDAAWIDQLEVHWRRGGVPADDDVRLQQAMTCWSGRQARWRAFAGGRRQPLSTWLQNLRELLRDAPAARTWTDDPAGRAVWQAVRLEQASARPDVDGLSMSLDDFIAWVDAALDAAQYIEAVDREAAQVLITPLARAMLRPFGAVVLPGADERRLGLPPPAAALLGDGVLRRLGLPDRSARAQRVAHGFEQLLRHPRLVIVRRAADADEHLGPSALVERLQLARHEQGLPPVPEQPPPLQTRALVPTPVAPPLPRASDAALPTSLSASALEALRSCPYRFFARTVLGLAEAEELAPDPGKRDFGTLLHEVLQRFHDGQPQHLSRADAQDRLMALADEVAARSQLDGPAMLPFRAGMPAFAQRYLDWLASRAAAGWHFAEAEVDRRCSPPSLHGLELKGRIDRIDRHDSGATQVLDYKTGSLRGLKDKVKHPLEDTQLAFYAAQMLCSDNPPVRLDAAYVALDDRDAIAQLDHPDVVSTAHALLDGLSDEWARLRQGAAMPALGEGMVCEYCEARGLCRRDHWSADPGEPLP
ncbi:MAG: PD-(D/E)XK nuclease family protein [Burkholderiales bacterium]|nr:PD-(D/E)XK nuclease family protein [Burkholderiales bacterium]